MPRQTFLLAVPLLALCASAQADFYSHRYAGVSLTEIDQQGFCSNAEGFVRGLSSDSWHASGQGCSEGGDGWKLYGGWRWTPHLAVEAGYQQLADSKLGFRLDADQNQYLQFRDKIRTRLANAYVVGHWPIAAGFSVFGKVGGGLWWSELSERRSGAVLFEFEDEEGNREKRLVEINGRIGASDNGFHWGYGAGISYQHRNRWSIRAEWESFGDLGSEELRGDYDVEVASLGWSMHF